MVDGINLALDIGVDKGKKCFNVNLINLDLSKSQELVNIIKTLYEWYINGNINAYLSFKVTHFVESVNMSPIVNDDEMEEKMKRKTWGNI